jgi:uncharacterized metal-binding protein
MANWIAIRLDREGRAEMSCIAGVGGDVPALVRTAQSGRPILAIDGCRLHCVRNCLARHGITPTWHRTLAEAGVRKKMHEDFDPAEADACLDTIRAALPEAPVPAPAPVAP